MSLGLERYSGGVEIFNRFAEGATSMVKQPPRVSYRRLPRDLVLEVMAESAYRNFEIFPARSIFGCYSRMRR